MFSNLQFVFACLVAFAVAGESITYASAPITYSAAYPYPGLAYAAAKPLAYTQYSSPLTYTTNYRPYAYSALPYSYGYNAAPYLI